MLEAPKKTPAVVHTFALDPGKRLCGVAYAVGDEIVNADVVRGARKELVGPTAWRTTATAVLEWLADQWRVHGAPEAFVCCVEVMKYRDTKPGAVKDLLELSAVTGAVVAAMPGFTQFRSYRAEDWHNNTPKGIAHERMRLRLARHEMAAIETGLQHVALTLRHNAYDAVCIALHSLGRMGITHGTRTGWNWKT